MVSSKKGQLSFEILIHITRLIFLVILGFSITFLMKMYITDVLNVQQIQAQSLVNKFYYSPHGIVYFDEELKQAIPGIIDISKLTNENLNSVANYSDSSFIAAKVSIYDSNEKFIKSAYYNNVTYYRWIPILNSGITGSGGVREINKTLLVTVVEDKEKYEGVMVVSILQPGN